MQAQLFGELRAAAEARRLRQEQQNVALERVAWDQNVKGFARRFHRDFSYVMSGGGGGGADAAAAPREGTDVDPQLFPGADILQLTQTNEHIGTTVYTAAVQVARFIEHSFGRHFAGKSIVELGSGTGLVGIVAACLGARVVLTDMEGPVLDNLRKNVARLPQDVRDRVSVRNFVWGTTAVEDLLEPLQGAPLDMILAVEVVYEMDHVRALSAALADIYANHSPRILWAHDLRGRPGVPAFREFIATLADLSEVPPQSCAPGYCCQHVKMWWADPKAVHSSQHPSTADGDDSSLRGMS